MASATEVTGKGELFSATKASRIMKDHHHRSQNMDGCSSKRRSKYDKEMDHAFTLIFHNIKRLQDGHLSNNEAPDQQGDGASGKKSSMTLQVPLDRQLSSSDPSLELVQEDTKKQTCASNLVTRPKSRSFSGVPTASQDSSKRRVRFSEDFSAREHLQRPSLPRRPNSDLLPKPTIILTKES